jgi:UDP-glucose:(heptosyl)LPS alpha-1,3-glucosyltransferase
LLHPAYNENTGTVLLEALVAGLPVICSGACGYAHYIAEAGAGVALAEPFEAEAFLNAIETVADNEQRQKCSEAGLKFADEVDLYGMPNEAADLVLKNKEVMQ